jgi:hypothetical protein
MHLSQVSYYLRTFELKLSRYLLSLTLPQMFRLNHIVGHQYQVWSK